MRSSRFVKLSHGFAGILLAILLWPAFATADNLAVVYPEIREPYRQVFISIAAGVARLENLKVLHYEASPNASGDDLRQWLKRNEIDGVVALGNAGVALAAQVDDLRLPQVVGAVAYAPNLPKSAGILLDPAPSEVFRYAQKINRKLKTIHVVFEEAFHEPVIEEAQAAALSLGLSLQTYPVTDLRQAAERYRSVQQSMHSARDAIWLPMGGPARDKAILQTLLENAWAKDQMIISSSLSDVRRGVLLAMYPDNEAMGEALGRLWQKQNTKYASSEMEFATTLMQAINLRTADHLGYRFNKQELRQFEFLYPPP